MDRNNHPRVSYSTFALALAACLAGSAARAAGPAPAPVAPAAGSRDVQPEEGLLDPNGVKAGDKVQLVLKEINQRSGPLVFTAVKSAYGTVKSVSRLEVDGKENIVFEIVPYGSDGKTVLKYDKETGQSYRVEPTVRFGTLQIAKILRMPSDEEMKKVAGYREAGGGEDADTRALVQGEDKESVERRIRSLRSQVRTLRMAVAEQEAAAVSPAKPPVALLRDKGGASRADSASETSAQDIVAARKNAAEAAVIRLRFRLSEKEDDLREEMKKAADYGVVGFAVEDLAELPPAERRALLSSQAKMLGGDIRRLRLAIVEQEATAKEAVKSPVPLLRDKGGAARADSALDTSAQEIVEARKKATEAAIIRLKARLSEKEDELRLVKDELAKLDGAEKS